MDENKLLEFHKKLTYENIHDVSIYENELKQSYKEILQGLLINYAEYRKHYPKFLASFEANNTRAISYSINLFFELFNKLIDYDNFLNFDLSILKIEANDDTVRKIKTVFEATFSKTTQHRISEETFDTSSLSETNKLQIISLFVDKLQMDAKTLNWDNNLVQDTSMNLVLLRQLLNSTSHTEIFYYLVGLFLDRLFTSELFQLGRDISEEIIIAAFKDNVPELGFFNAFRFYSNTESIHASLLYANLSLTCLLKKQKPYSEKYIKEVLWQGMKLFRNVKLFPLSVKLYNSIPSNLVYNGYERRSIDHTYFTTLLYLLEPSLPNHLLEYLHKERENIFSGGINDALPWLLTLYNINRLYPDSDFSLTGLGYYQNIFESIVPPELIKKQKDILEATSLDLKQHLKESLIKLNETRNVSDFVYDNSSAIRISNRLIEYSYKNKDYSGFLMSMMLKSDFSILFKSKETSDLAPLILPDLNIDFQETIYENRELLFNSLPLNDSTAFICIAHSEQNMYQFLLLNKSFSIAKIEDWNYNTFKKIANEDYFTDFTFEDSVRDKSGVRVISPEEFQEEEDEIIAKLKFSQVNIPENIKELNVVKDMDISRFPHNLLINQENKFSAKNLPICNVLSTEWFVQTKDSKFLSNEYSKSIWVPTESGDIPLNYLFSNIEDTLNNNSFEISNLIELQHPLNSDINIICSHGAKNISETQIIFQENNPTYNLDKIIGTGRILIFFVCYSGSMKTEFFRNSITSMVKRFISQGYESVIAPFWALDVTIPRYWLPEFLKEIDEGNTISNAVFLANKKVYERYPTPAAWACLHLYGNPNFRKE